MEAKEFADIMNTITFNVSENDLQVYGRDYIRDLESSYRIRKRNQGNPKEPTDPLLSLIIGYDTSRLEIGAITFNKVIRQDGHYYYFGRCEADDLVIEKSTGHVLLKMYAKDHILNSCASNSSKFLDALFIAASYLAQFPIGADVSKEEDVCVVSAQCAVVAGGETHINFYKMLLGCYE